MSEKENLLVTFKFKGELHHQALFSSQITHDKPSINPIIQSAIDAYFQYNSIVISENDSITNIIVYQKLSNGQNNLIAKQSNYRFSQEMEFFNKV
jgi:hypothetical protein